MGIGNGYYNETIGAYEAKTAITWDDYDASSVGNNWDNWQTWLSIQPDIGLPFIPNLPLEYTTDLIDFGSKQLINPVVTVVASTTPDLVIYYGDTIDSSGGSIDNASSVTINSATTTVNAIKARYFQIKVSVGNEEDSAGAVDENNIYVIPYISSIDVELKTEKRTVTITDLETYELSGSVGLRTLDNDMINGIGTVSSIICQAHLPAPRYMQDGYVDAGYTVTLLPETPIVLVDKATTPPVLNIFDIDTFGHRTRIDCTIDAVVTGLPTLRRSDSGNLVEDN